MHDPGHVSTQNKDHARWKSAIIFFCFILQSRREERFLTVTQVLKTHLFKPKVSCESYAIGRCDSTADCAVAFQMREWNANRLLSAHRPYNITSTFHLIIYTGDCGAFNLSIVGANIV